jgi:hypothetical protein
LKDVPAITLPLQGYGIILRTFLGGCPRLYYGAPLALDALLQALLPLGSGAAMIY